MNIEKIYIQFYQCFEECYKNKIRFVNRTDRKKYIKEHLSEVAKKLSGLMDEKTSPLLVNTWIKSTLKNLEDMPKMDDQMGSLGSGDRLKEEIKNILEDSSFFLSNFNDSSWSALSEKIKLNKDINPHPQSGEGLDKKTYKL